jgi:hypothetical protein
VKTARAPATVSQLCTSGRSGHGRELRPSWLRVFLRDERDERDEWDKRWLVVGMKCRLSPIQPIS